MTMAEKSMGWVHGKRQHGTQQTVTAPPLTPLQGSAAPLTFSVSSQNPKGRHTVPTLLGRTVYIWGNGEQVPGFSVFRDSYLHLPVVSLVVGMGMVSALRAKLCSQGYLELTGTDYKVGGRYKQARPKSAQT